MRGIAFSRSLVFVPEGRHDGSLAVYCQECRQGAIRPAKASKDSENRTKAWKIQNFVPLLWGCYLMGNPLSAKHKRRRDRVGMRSVPIAPWIELTHLGNKQCLVPTRAMPNGEYYPADAFMVIAPNLRPALTKSADRRTKAVGSHTDDSAWYGPSDELIRHQQI